jgi:hypothetical protein
LGDGLVNGFSRQRAVDDLGFIFRQISQFPAFADFNIGGEIFAEAFAQLLSAPDAL